MEKRFTKDGITLLFYKKEGDEKYSFLIEGEPEATKILLANCKTKRVPEKNIHYAVKGIFEKLEMSGKIENNIEHNCNPDCNPVVLLSEKCQKYFGSNIETRIISKTGPDHHPIIWVEIELPDGSTFKASGSNQKIAKQKAALAALATLKI